MQFKALALNKLHTLIFSMKQVEMLTFCRIHCKEASLYLNTCLYKKLVNQGFRASLSILEPNMVMEVPSCSWSVELENAEANHCLPLAFCTSVL